MGNFGMSIDTFEEQVGAQTEQINRLDDVKKYYHRVILGTRRHEYMLYPTVITDNETGELKQQFVPVDLPPKTTTLLDKVGNVEKRLRREHGEKDPNTAFYRRTRYLFLVIDREQPEKGVTVWEYPWSVTKEIMKKQKQPSSKNKDMAMWGAMYSWDAVIEKKQDNTKNNPQYAISYDVEVDPESATLTGQMPLEAVLDADYDDTEFVKKALTDDEYSRVMSWMEDHPNMFESYINEKSDSALLEQFETHPINLYYVTNDRPLLSTNIGGEVVVFADEVKEELAEEISSEYFLNSGEVGQLPESTEDADVPEEFKDTEEADYEEVDEVEDEDIDEDEFGDIEDFDDLEDEGW